MKFRSVRNGGVSLTFPCDCTVVAYPRCGGLGFSSGSRSGANPIPRSTVSQPLVSRSEANLIPRSAVSQSPGSSSEANLIPRSTVSQSLVSRSEANLIPRSAVSQSPGSSSEANLIPRSTVSQSLGSGSVYVPPHLRLPEVSDGLPLQTSIPEPLLQNKKTSIPVQCLLQNEKVTVSDQSPVQDSIPVQHLLESETVTNKDSGKMLRKEGVAVDVYVQFPLLDPQPFDKMKLKPPRGILFHGPPGSGKTRLASAIANEAGVPFYQISATELISGALGASVEKIRDVFSKAYRTAPSIVFIDEIDAIGSKRENQQMEMEKRILTQLLTCMDGPKNVTYSCGGLVVTIGATNRVDALDLSLRRPGRFDCEIALGVPDEDARVDILSAVVQRLRLEGSLKIARLTPPIPVQHLLQNEKVMVSDQSPVQASISSPFPPTAVQVVNTVAPTYPDLDLFFSTAGFDLVGDEEEQLEIVDPAPDFPDVDPAPDFLDLIDFNVHYLPHQKSVMVSDLDPFQASIPFASAYPELDVFSSMPYKPTPVSDLVGDVDKHNLFSEYEVFTEEKHDLIDFNSDDVHYLPLNKSVLTARSTAVVGDSRGGESGDATGRGSGDSGGRESCDSRGRGSGDSRGGGSGDSSGWGSFDSQYGVSRSVYRGCCIYGISGRIRCEVCDGTGYLFGGADTRVYSGNTLLGPGKIRVGSGKTSGGSGKTRVVYGNTVGGSSNTGVVSGNTGECSGNTGGVSGNTGGGSGDMRRFL